MVWLYLPDPPPPLPVLAAAAGMGSTGAPPFPAPEDASGRSCSPVQLGSMPMGQPFVPPGPQSWASTLAPGLHSRVGFSPSREPVSASSSGPASLTTTPRRSSITQVSLSSPRVPQPGEWGYEYAGPAQSVAKSEVTVLRRISVPVEVVSSSCSTGSTRLTPRDEEQVLAQGRATSRMPSTLANASPTKASMMPDGLLARIEGVVAKMEREIDAECRSLPASPEIQGDGGVEVSTSACEVDWLGQRLKAMEKEHEVAELRSQHLADLRRTVAEGRNRESSSHYLSLSSDSSVAVANSAAYIQALKSRKSRLSKDDGEMSIGGSHNISTVMGGSDDDDEEEEDGQGIEGVLAELQQCIAEEFAAVGDQGGPAARLLDQLQGFAKAILRREGFVRRRVLEAEAVAEEQRQAAAAAMEVQKSVEADLRALEEHSCKVLDDCRELQARLKELEQGCSRDRDHALEGQQARSRCEDLELQLQEKHKELEETADGLQAISERRSADLERSKDLERELQEGMVDSSRQQQLFQQQLAEMQRQLRESQEREESQKGVLTSAVADFESKLANVEAHAAEDAQRAHLHSDHLVNSMKDLQDELAQVDAARDHHQGHRELLDGQLGGLEDELEQTQAELRQEQGLCQQLRDELQEAKELAQDVQADATDALRRTDESRRRTQAMSEEQEIQLRKQIAELEMERLAARARAPSVLVALRPRSSSCSKPVDFKDKVWQTKSQAAEALRRTAGSHSRLINLELAAVAEGRWHGLNPRESLPRLAPAALGEALAERRQCAQLVDSAEHDLRSLREEALSHHELSENEAEDIAQQMELDVRCCEDEKRLLLLRSPLADLPEEMLDVLADSSADLTSKQWHLGYSPMHWAAQNGRRDIVDFLLRREGGASLVNLADDHGHTPLFYADRNHQVTVSHYLRERAGASLKSVQRPSVRGSFDDRLPPRYRAVLEQVQSKGWASVAWRDGYTMLHWAASKGEADICTHLLSLGADPDARDKFGRTSLDCATDAHHTEAGIALREFSRLAPTDRRHCTERSRKTEGDLSSSVSRQAESGRRATAPLLSGGTAAEPLAAGESSLRRKTVELEDASTSRRRTPELANGNSRRHTAELADDPQRSYSRGRTSLESLESLLVRFPNEADRLPKGYVGVIHQIDEVGWDQIPFAKGFTLLHWAAKNRCPGLVSHFLARGADPRKSDDAGRNAVDYARDSGSQETLAALQSPTPSRGAALSGAEPLALQG
ncbi:unnamed protein product [Polarella glacialis]|uniref:Uncharacterized protein n=1 Tax=Polarella glacialis TaxID=89957 RepID=A0A813FE51_POLGL|nr:unnamed protein product [Polarella glacialis]